jgi:hypothetical protein
MKDAMKINIYRNRGEWCYAAFNCCCGEYDHSDVIDVANSAPEAEAREEMLRQFPGAEIARVDDTNE